MFPIIVALGGIPIHQPSYVICVGHVFSALPSQLSSSVESYFALRAGGSVPTSLIRRSISIE